MKKFISIILCVVFIASLIPHITSAADISDKYGYSFLTENQKTVYDMLDNAVGSISGGFAVDKSLQITADSFAVIREVLDSDHPEYFWFVGAQINLSGGYITKITPTYQLDGATAKSAQIKLSKSVFEEKLNLVISELRSTGISDDYGKALWLHDKVTSLVTYEITPNDQNAYGALVDGKAVCSGYAKLYQILLKKAGISAWTVKGYGVDPVNGTPVNHAWNIMWLEGCCVYTDVTWADQGTDIYHIYFARDLEAFSGDHAADDMFVPMLPTCTSACKSLGYFDRVKPENLFSESPAAESVGALFEANADGYSVTAVICDKNANVMMSWLQNSANLSSAIRSALPNRSYSVSAASVGNSRTGQEIHLNVYSDELFTGTLTGDVTSFYSNTDNVKIELVKKDGSASYSLDKTGNKASYSFSNVPSGDYTLRISKKNHATREYDVTVGFKEMTFNTKIHLLGDTNGDGKLNTKDTAFYKSYIGNLKTADAYIKLCMDVNSDGRINTKDCSIVKSHVTNRSSIWS